MLVFLMWAVCGGLMLAYLLMLPVISILGLVIRLTEFGETLRGKLAGLRVMTEALLVCMGLCSVALAGVVVYVIVRDIRQW